MQVLVRLPDLASDHRRGNRGQSFHVFSLQYKKKGRFDFRYFACSAGKATDINKWRCLNGNATRKG